MTNTALPTGAKPPLHRRFNEEFSLKRIRNRYKHAHEKISDQVAVLQSSAAFRQKCAAYYAQGYKDWVILAVVMNCMWNWKAAEQGIKAQPGADLSGMRKILDNLKGVTYPPERFLGFDMEIQFKMHAATVLQTYGFTPRRVDFKPEVIEKFLRERMRHFELDVPHRALFGEPSGDWPEMGNWED